MAEMEVKYGRRRGSSKKDSSAEEASRRIQSAALRQVAVLPKAKWLRIQEELNHVNKDEERIREAANQRKALHQQSKDMVKLWSNTLAGQRQKRLEAKKIREEIEEEERKQTDIEEAKYREQKRKEAIGRAKAQLYYQTDRVRGLHSALLLTEVLKEREAQIDLKQQMQTSSKDVDKEFVDLMKCRHEEALRKDKEKGVQKKLETLAVAEEQRKQIDDNELKKVQLKIEDKKEGEEIQQCLEIYLQQQRLEEERQVNQRRLLMHDHLENLAKRDAIRAAGVQKQEQEEEQRKRFLAAKQKMLKLRKEKETELFMEGQRIRDRIADKLTVKQQTQTVREEERIAQAVAERDAKEAHEQRVKEEKMAAELKSITAHREAVMQEKKQRDKIAQQAEQDTAQARKEADGIFSEKQKLKAEKIRQDGKASLDYCVTQMVAKLARSDGLKREDRELKAMNAELLAEEETEFQQYSRQVINAALDAERNIVPLFKAAKEGMGGGAGPICGGVRPSYLVQDGSGAQMPRYVSDLTQNVKELNETADIQKAKRRLGFTW
ncbi:cilia- and flagella- associated protein 210-like [Genypterus blacodes]|uniref:cilia- and flagella- associated protein 210-like n=1 Tax=Genypterus blacodes TaxID=154954 RepID=UPI003F76D430